MAYTWPRAPLVATGDPVTSGEVSGLARAVNERLRSGLGDGPWRVMFYQLGLWRQIRNPDASFNLWPPVAEYFERYQSLDPSEWEWPIAGRSDPEGANLGSPVPAYIWGNATANLDSESVRLSYVPISLPPDDRQPSTPSEFWLLGKLQRGAVDLSTGAVGCPAWDAARSWAQIRYGRLSPHLTGWGGYLPRPELAPDLCEDPNTADEYPAPPNYLLKFTPTASGEARGLTVKTYPGTCQIGPSTTEDYSLHVWASVTTPWDYIVQLNNGTVEVLPKALWTEGPYSGQPWLKHTEGHQVARALNQFAREHRGATQQAIYEAGAVPTTWNAEAFACQEFFLSQYPLAPARGQQQEDGLLAIYPSMWKAAPSEWALDAGVVMGSHTVADGCRMCGMLVTGTLLDKPLRVQAKVGSRVLGVAGAAPNASGNTEAMVWFTTPAEAGEVVQVSLAARADFKGAGRIDVELAELYAYKPDLSDLALCLRLASAKDEPLI